MKNKLDIWLGAAAWLIALVPLFLFALPLFHRHDVPHALGWAIPVPWFCVAVVLITFTNTPLRKLWWAWLSAPFAFSYWLLLLWINLFCSFD